MPLISTYSVGTVTVSAGSAIVTGAGTSFVAGGLRSGDVFEMGGLSISIQSVDSNTRLTLVKGWPGTSGNGAYEIRLTPDAARVLASSRELITGLQNGNLPALSGLPSASDALPYFTGPGSAAVTPLTSLARTLLSLRSVQAFKEALGLAGYAGAGIRVLGTRSSVSNLPASGAVGDAYLVGSNLHIWTGSAWANAGSITGPAGADGVPIYSSRTAAEAAVPTLSTSVTDVLVREGTGLVVRTRFGGADDALFDTAPRWGVTLRLADILALNDKADSAQVMPLLTPSYANRDAAVSGASTLPASITQILVREGTALVIRSRTASADDPLYAEGPRWGVMFRIDPNQLGALVSEAVTPLQANLSSPFRTTVAEGDVRVLRTDANGQAIEIYRPTGLDAIYCPEFWERGAAAIAPFLNLPGSGSGHLYSTASWDVIGVHGQSLSTGGLYDSLAFNDVAGRSPEGVLQLTGMARNDGPIVGDTLGASSYGYAPNATATGVAPARPGATRIGAAYPMALARDIIQRKAGIKDQAPTITTSHGWAGIELDILDSDPNTGRNTNTDAWQWLVRYYQQLAAVAARANRRVNVPWHLIVHGTSAQGWVAGRYRGVWLGLQRDTRALFDSLGFGGGKRWMLTQSGGRANTSNTVTDPWHVLQDQMELVEAGAAELGTCEYWYPIDDNDVHPAAASTARFSEASARGMTEIEAGRRWSIHRPKRVMEGSTLILDYDSLRPGEYLRAVSATKYNGQGIDGFLGYQLVGGTITEVELRGRTARLTYTGTPTRIRYANQRQDTTSFANNRYNAMRGLVKASDEWPSELIPGAVVERPTPIFDLAL
ncbi:MAG: hypothetical protein FJX25_05855 [Alphaproteobacteria bacterium]|nr:hypothetical protein [Alphaproteobacteria bacterium]